MAWPSSDDFFRPVKQRPFFAAAALNQMEDNRERRRLLLSRVLAHESGERACRRRLVNLVQQVAVTCTESCEEEEADEFDWSRATSRSASNSLTHKGTRSANVEGLCCCSPGYNLARRHLSNGTPRNLARLLFRRTGSNRLICSWSCAEAERTKTRSPTARSAAEVGEYQFHGVCSHDQAAS